MINAKHGQLILSGTDFEIGADIMVIIAAILTAEENKNVDIIGNTVKCAKETDNLKVLLDFAKRVQEEL